MIHLWGRYRERSATECYAGIRSSQGVDGFEDEIHGDEAHTMIDAAFRPPGLVLDVGCGAGRYCYFLRAAGHTAIGLDLACRNLQRFAGRSDKVYLLGGSGCALPIAANTVDYVLIVGIAYEILDKESREQLFREIARVLKKPGGLCFYVKNLYPNVHIRMRALLGRVLKAINGLTTLGPTMMLESVALDGILPRCLSGQIWWCVPVGTATSGTVSLIGRGC